MKQGLPLPGLRWRGLTLQLFLFTVLPLTVLLLVIVIASQSLHHESMRALAGDRDLRAVRAAANSLSHEIEHRGTTLQLFAEQISAGRNTAVLLDSNSLPGFDGGLALVDDSGKTISGEIPGIPQFNLPARTAKDSVQFTDPLRRADGAWVVLALTQTGPGEWLVGAFTPASLARSSLSGVLTPQTAVQLVDHTQGQVEVLYATGAGSTEMEMPAGERPGVAEVLSGESGVNYTEGMSGMSADHSGEHVVAFSPVPPLGWGLVIEEPWEASAGPLLTTTQFAPLILAPVLVLAIIALWFGAQQIIQPLQALENRAARLASGDFDAIRRPTGGISEIRHLQGTLAEMARDLQAAQEALHGYIGALTAGVETERRSLARELHDDTLQSLIALNQQAQMALLHATNPQVRQSLLDLQSRTAETIINLRRAIGGLRPIYLEDLGLVAALGMLAKQIEEARGIPVAFDVSGSERRLPGETELAFYRIAQEALNNAAYHAQAKHIRLDLAFCPEDTTLTVQDDGAGFAVPTDPNAFARQGHYGLLGMRERAELVGAEIAIQSEVGKGTSVIVKRIEGQKG